jgi:hypothetical protein
MKVENIYISGNFTPREKPDQMNPMDYVDLIPKISDMIRRRRAAGATRSYTDHAIPDSAVSSSTQIGPD